MSWLYQENNCIFSIGQCYIVLIVQTVVWMLAAVYCDNVQPNRHGVRLPLWYPLMPSYWVNLFKSNMRTRRSSKQAAAPASASVSRSGSQGGTKLTPFAAPDAARRVAKAISEVKEDEQLVIRCSSSAGGADPAAARGLGGTGSLGSTARHSVSSGMLRRRDNRNSSSGAAADPASSTGRRDSFAGELVSLPSRSAAIGTLGRGPHLASHQLSTHSTQLMINPSVTVMQLSEYGSDAVHGSVLQPGAASASTGVVAAAAAPGTTITLQQYQQMQADSRRRAAAKRHWWEFWRTGEDSLTLAAKKHDSMVAAAASASSGSAAVLQNKEALGTYGVTPVVLDSGVLQEEQRMKAALFGGEGKEGVWVYVFLADGMHGSCAGQQQQQQVRHYVGPFEACKLTNADAVSCLCACGPHQQKPRVCGPTSRTSFRCLACARCTSSPAAAGGGSSGAALSPSSSSRRRSSMWLWSTAGLGCPRASCCASWGPTALARQPPSTASLVSYCGCSSKDGMHKSGAKIASIA